MALIFFAFIYVFVITVIQMLYPDAWTAQSYLSLLVIGLLNAISGLGIIIKEEAKALRKVKA